MRRPSWRLVLTFWLVAALLLPAFGAVMPAAAAPSRVSALTFASGEADGSPRNGSDRFNVGVGRVYAFFDFSSVGPDDPITGVWYQGARVLLTQSETLRGTFRGSSAPDSGTIWFYAAVSGGFAPGRYRLEVRVNDDIVQTGQFRVEPRRGQAVFAHDLDLYLNGKWVVAESFVVGRPQVPTDRLLDSDEFTIDVVPDAIWSHGQTGVIAGPLPQNRQIKAVFQHFSEWSLPEDVASPRTTSN